MIRVRIVKGLDIALPDAELYLTLSLEGLSRTSRLTAREKFEDEGPSPSPSPAPGEGDGPAIRREQSRSKQLGWVWEEELDLTLPPTTKKDHAEIEVCCFDAQFRPCGKVKIPLERLAPNESVQQWYSLMDSANPKASVMLKLTYIPESPHAQGASPSKVKLKTSQSAELGGPAKDEKRNSLSESPIELPMGLAEFFVVAGCAQETARQDRLKMLAKPRKKPLAFAITAPVDELSQASVAGPDAVTLSPVILDRYPKQKDKDDSGFPAEVQMFLLPDGVEIVKVIPPSAKQPRFFTFVLVTNGVRTYGFCLEAFEPLPRVNKATDYEDLYAPVVFCYLTRVPLPHMTFKYILQQTYEARKKKWYERIVLTVVKSIPVPLPGLFSVDYDLLTPERSRISLPSASELPALVFPSMCTHTFDWFPLDSLIDVWIAALTEQKILVHSHNRDALAMVTETIVQLMYPFKWENAYVPVLPTSLMQLFDAPIPAILGLRTDAMKLIPGGSVESLVDHWIIMDADKCTVHFPKHEPLPALPIELRARLYRTIRTALSNRALSTDQKDRKIRLAFLECLASMLQGYRESFFVLSTDSDASTVFNRSQFFQRQASQKLHQVSQMTSHTQLPGQSQIGDGGKEFLDRFFDTTAFERFKVSQYDPETDFFHAVYAARRSRERERDQRAAALIALQGEAETAAMHLQQHQQQQQVTVGGGAASSNVSSPATSTVVKIWAAREARWNDSALEPLDPALGRRERSSSSQKVFHVKSPLKLNEKVLCPPFGFGTVHALEEDTTSGATTVVVKMDWGANGYFQLDLLQRVWDQDEVSVAPLKESKNIDDTKPAVLPTESERSIFTETSYSSEDEDEEEDELLKTKQKPLVIKTDPAKFDSTPLVLVDLEALMDLPQSDPEAVRKSLNHFKRILEGDDSKIAQASAAARPIKSASDAKLERFMQRAITNVFQDKPVPENDLRECANNLTNSQFARDMLIYVLKSQQSTHNSGEANWLATPGRGRRLGPEAFASLHDLFDSLLKACAAKEDFTNGRCALEVSQYYYCEDETLQNKLKRHPLWSKPVFWEYAFAEQVVLAMDPSKAIPEPPSMSDQAATEAPAVALARFHEQGKKVDPGQEDVHRQKLFEHLSFFLHTMLNLDVSEEMSRVFVDRVASMYELDEDQKATLNMLITNISRAASYNNEEERAQQMVNEGSQPESPNSTSKRSLRKHYSVEALANSTMMARLFRRPSTKGKSPSSTSGTVSRRDSQTSQDTNS